MRRRAATGIVLALGVLGWGAAPALADPAIDFAPGSALTQQAQDVARAVWGVDPCGGTVTISWMSLDPSVNASSTWTNPVGQYDAPAENFTCAIAFNNAIAWDWIRYCSVLVHEYGHLTGHPHSPDAADVMSPYYTRPVDQCVAAAPAQAVPAQAAPAEALAAPTEQQRFAAQLGQPHAKAPVARAARHVRVGNIVAVVTDHARGAHRHGHRAHRRHSRGSHRHSHRWYLLQKYHHLRAARTAGKH